MGHVLKFDHMDCTLISQDRADSSQGFPSEKTDGSHSCHKGECAILLDIHTGLGKHRVGELISYLPSSSEQFKQIDDWFSGGLRSMGTGQSVSAAVECTLTAAFDRMMPAQSYATGLEFGTMAPLAVLNALHAGQWCQNTGFNIVLTCTFFSRPQ